MGMTPRDRGQRREKNGQQNQKEIDVVVVGIREREAEFVSIFSEPEMELFKRLERVNI